MIARELVRFGCVGVAAMAAHFCVVMTLVGQGVNPLLANVAAFAVAFQISYYGHRRWTFGVPGSGAGYLKMLVVSSAAFLVNESLYALLLATRLFDYRVALLIVLATVAGGTYLASRVWVFRRA